MAKRLRVALVRPQVDVQHKFSKLVESLALGYLAAALRIDGHDVVLLDGMIYDWSPEETTTRILETRADMVGFTTTVNHFPVRLQRIVELLEEAAFPGRVLVGGHAISFFPERILNAVARIDAVVSGEGETVIRQAAAAIAAGTPWNDLPGLSVRDGLGVRRNPPHRHASLDALPWAARDLTGEVIAHDGLVCISTSRGCYARCTFCSVPRFYGLDQNRPFASGGWISRSVEPIVAEIASLHERFNLRELLIVDDEFFGGTDAGFDRARHFGQRMAESGLQVAFALSCRAENVHEDVLTGLQRGGLAHVFVGIETGTQRGLQRYGKGHSVEQNRRAIATIKALGLSFQAGFMLFNPWSTIADVQENLRFLEDVGECKPMVINSSVDPHFGAPLSMQMRRDGVLVDSGLAMQAAYLDPLVETAKAVAEACAVAFQPYMNLLAGLRSSITWEWRRPVPTRGLEEERLLDALESRINCLFSRVVVAAVDRLADGHAAAGVAAEAAAALVDVEGQLKPAVALVINRLEAAEGEVRYWRQLEVIGTRAI
jgi:radical SAM superfamily enzyme YgiQ (UPF0313 family)